MPVVKSLIRRLKRRELVVPLAKKKRRNKVKRCLSSDKMFASTIVSLIYVCLRIKLSSGFSREFVQFIESSCIKMTSLRFILQSSLLVPLKVELMFSSSSTSSRMLAWPRVRNFTSRWLCAVTSAVSSKLDQFSGLKTLTLQGICVSSLVLILKWSLRITTLRC